MVSAGWRAPRRTERGAASKLRLAAAAAVAGVLGNPAPPPAAA
eukprot:SAG25_NODE_696_length_5890_cov_4.438612_1_plen_42_part_10